MLNLLFLNELIFASSNYGTIYSTKIFLIVYFVYFSHNF